MALDLPPGWAGGLDRMARALGSREPLTNLNRLPGGLEGKTFAFRVYEQPFVLKVYAGDGGEARTEFDNLAVVSWPGYQHLSQC